MLPWRINYVILFIWWPCFRMTTYKGWSAIPVWSPVERYLIEDRKRRQNNTNSPNLIFFFPWGYLFSCDIGLFRVITKMANRAWIWEIVSTFRGQGGRVWRYLTLVVSSFAESISFLRQPCYRLTYLLVKSPCHDTQVCVSLLQSLHSSDFRKKGNNRCLYMPGTQFECFSISH